MSDYICDDRPIKISEKYLKMTPEEHDEDLRKLYGANYPKIKKMIDDAIKEYEEQKEE